MKSQDIGIDLKHPFDQQAIHKDQRQAYPIEGNSVCEAIEKVKIGSVLTCESKRGACILGYGGNLASGRTMHK